MGSTTTNGYPYPVGTDRVMDGDDAIKALAEATDDKAGISAAGTCAVSVNNATSGVVTVTLPSGRFSAPPTAVQACGYNSSTYIWATSNITASSFQVTARYYLGSAMTASLTGTWQARS